MFLAIFAASKKQYTYLSFYIIRYLIGLYRYFSLWLWLFCEISILKYIWHGFLAYIFLILKFSYFSFISLRWESFVVLCHKRAFIRLFFDGSYLVSNVFQLVLILSCSCYVLFYNDVSLIAAFANLSDFNLTFNLIPTKIDMSFTFDL